VRQEAGERTPTRSVEIFQQEIMVVGVWIYSEGGADKFADRMISGCVPVICCTWVLTKRIYVLQLFPVSVNKHATGDRKWFVLQWKMQGRSEVFYKMLESYTCLLKKQRFLPIRFSVQSASPQRAQSTEILAHACCLDTWKNSQIATCHFDTRNEK
jgi:hypothetical protein